MQSINPKHASPKMTPEQAKLFWESLTLEQRMQFNQMMVELKRGDLKMTKIMTDDNEQIQRIILEKKYKPRKHSDSFYKHFKLSDINKDE
jgi:hypothetical protein